MTNFLDGFSDELSKCASASSVAKAKAKGAAKGAATGAGIAIGLPTALALLMARKGFRGKSAKDAIRMMTGKGKEVAMRRGKLNATAAGHVGQLASKATKASALTGAALGGVLG